VTQIEAEQVNSSSSIRERSTGTEVKEFRSSGVQEFRREVAGTRNRHLFPYSVTPELLRRWPFLSFVEKISLATARRA
jgi:hypothetical protein